MKIKLRLLPISFILLLLSGCSLYNTFTPADSREVFAHADWVKSQEALFFDYLGKSTDEVESIFGKPKEVFYSNSFRNGLPYKADLMWRYDESLTIGDSSLYDFLFKNNHLIKVEVFGPRESKTEKAIKYILM